jgi:hypothetical protein
MPAFIGPFGLEVMEMTFAIEPTVEATAFGTSEILNSDWWKEVVRRSAMNISPKQAKGENKCETISDEHWRPNE